MINRKNAEMYCSEDISKIENYEQAVNDNTQMWHCHHRLEVQGQFRNSKKLLKKCGLYYRVPAWQLIFLTPEDHIRIHHLGKHLSKETKKKMSCAKLGDKHPMFGKHLSEETRKKMSEKAKLRAPISEETRKKMSLAKLGKRCSAETCSKMSNALRKLSWWNNGIITKRSEKCPGEGWVRGRKITPKSAP